MKVRKPTESRFNGDRMLEINPPGDSVADIIDMMRRTNPNLDCEYVSEIVTSQIKSMGDDGVLVIPGRKDIFETTVERIDNETSKAILAKFKETKPTDEICVSEDVLCKFADFWRAPGEKPGYIPADIFWANTIPIKDCIIRNPNNEILRRNRHEDSGEYCRIAVFNKPEEVLGHVCGAISIHYTDGTAYFMTFGLGNPENDTDAADKLIMSEAVGLLETNDRALERAFYINDHFFKANAEGLFGTLFAYLNVWYGMQVALLNPTIEACFKRHSSMSVITDTKKNKKRKPKIRYVRRFVISEKVFDDTMKTAHVITKLCWYVTGHWREYKKTGKRIFIQGYWKGVLRDSKNHETRDREIVIDDTDVPDIYDNINDIFE